MRRERRMGRRKKRRRKEKEGKIDSRGWWLSKLKFLLQQQHPTLGHFKALLLCPLTILFSASGREKHQRVAKGFGSPAQEILEEALDS